MVGRAHRNPVCEGSEDFPFRRAVRLEAGRRRPEVEGSRKMRPERCPSRITHQHARLRGGCGRHRNRGDEDGRESCQPFQFRSRCSGVTGMDALHGRSGRIGGHRLGRADGAARPRGRAVPSHSSFQRECHRQRTQCAGKQNAAQSGPAGRIAQHKVSLPRRWSAPSGALGPPRECLRLRRMAGRKVSASIRASSEALGQCGLADRDLHGDVRRVCQGAVHDAMLH